ncbi:MAG: hypothetical protein V4448_16315 [Pseudomonadota bacterium]
MRLSTVFGTMGGDEWTPPLPPVPAGSPTRLTAGIRQEDGSIAVVATLNLEGQQLRAERRSSILRTFQIMAAGIGETNIANVVILEREDTPSVIPAP